MTAVYGWSIAHPFLRLAVLAFFDSILLYQSRRCFEHISRETEVLSRKDVATFNEADIVAITFLHLSVKRSPPSNGHVQHHVQLPPPMLCIIRPLQLGRICNEDLMAPPYPPI